MKKPFKFILIAVVIITILGFVVVSFLTSILGDKTDITENTYIIENNLEDTVFVEKPVNGHDERGQQQKVIYINRKQFIMIFPKSSELYYVESLNKSFDQALTKWPINDTFILIHKTDTNNFIFGIKEKCKTEKIEHGFICIRYID